MTDSPEHSSGGDVLNRKTRTALLSETNLSTPVSHMRSMTGLLLAYWKSDQKKAAYLLAGAQAFLIVGDAVLGAAIGFLMKDVVDVLQQKDEFSLGNVMPLFFNCSALLSTYLVVNPWIASKRNLVGNKLDISWRGWLTDSFKRALKCNNAAHHISNIPGPVANPDMAIAQAVPTISGNVTGLGSGALSSSTKLTAFTAVVALNVSGPTFWMILGTAGAFAWGQTKLFQWVGKPLTPLNEQKNLTEGTFRAKLVGLFKDANQLAPHGERAIDRHKLQGSFDEVQQTAHNLANANFKYNFLTGSFLQTSHFIYFLVGGLVHKFVDKGMTWGAAGQLTQGFFELQNALAWWGNIVPARATVKANGQLLIDLAQQIELAQNPHSFYAQNGHRAEINVIKEKRGSILIKDLTLDHPTSGQPMIHIPELEIKQGERIVVMGPSGSGKSSFLKGIAGCFYHGTGNIYVPEDKNLLLANSYILPDATLKENIAFPDETNGYPEEDFEDALRKAELVHLIPFLDKKARENNDWRSLSDGEKQRLAYARVFLQKPDIAFLDEATSGMDEALQDKISQRLIGTCPDMSIISNAHRNLDLYHTKRIDIQDGTIRVSTFESPIIFKAPPTHGVSMMNHLQ